MLVLIALLTILFASLVAWANGANDVSKGVATLVGSRLATYRQGLTWGTAWTVAGALAAVAFTASLFQTFSTGLVAGAFADSPLFPLSVSAGAFGWVLIATRTGLPVSTTHSLAGAIVGAALAAAGAGGVHWTPVFTTVAVPLAFSPILATGLAYLVHAAASHRLSAAAKYCVCVMDVPGPSPSFGSAHSLPNPSGAALASRPVSLPLVVVNQRQVCLREEGTEGVRLTDAAHWLSSAALSFARGLNDTPKIVALGTLATAAVGVGAPALYIVGAGAMGAGSFLAGRRVTRTLAQRVTDIDPLEGLAASGVAAALVLSASFVAVPVSTTHVASGAIVGVGLRGGASAVKWRTVSTVLAAWLITMPVAAVISAIAWRVGALLS